MKWTDTADDTRAEWHARGVSLQPLTRDEWRALPSGERTRVGPSSGRVVVGVAFRGDADAKWIRVAMADMEAETPTWRIWDMRRGAVLLATGISDLPFALALASVAASSKFVRLGLGAAMVLAAAAIELRATWQRERA